MLYDILISAVNFPCFRYNRLRFSAGSSDGFFQYDVTDGEHTVRDQLLPIKVIHLQLALATGAPLQVFPGSGPQRVTVVQLNATISNPRHSRSVVFNVEQPPTHGRLGRFQFSALYSSFSSFNFPSINKHSIKPINNNSDSQPEQEQKRYRQRLKRNVLLITSETNLNELSW